MLELHAQARTLSSLWINGSLPTPMTRKTLFAGRSYLEPCRTSRGTLPPPLIQLDSVRILARPSSVPHELGCDWSTQRTIEPNKKKYRTYWIQLHRVISCHISICSSCLPFPRMLKQGSLTRRLKSLNRTIPPLPCPKITTAGEGVWPGMGIHGYS